MGMWVMGDGLCMMTQQRVRHSLYLSGSGNRAGNALLLARWLLVAATGRSGVTNLMQFSLRGLQKGRYLIVELVVDTAAAATAVAVVALHGNCPSRNRRAFQRRVFVVWINLFCVLMQEDIFFFKLVTEFGQFLGVNSFAISSALGVHTISFSSDTVKFF